MRRPNFPRLGAARVSIDPEWDVCNEMRYSLPMSFRPLLEAPIGCTL